MASGGGARAEEPLTAKHLGVHVFEEGKAGEEGAIYDAVAKALKTGIEDLVPTGAKPLARHYFSPSCEKEINHAINIVYNMSYVFYSMSCYFARDCVALPGLTKFFRMRSAAERSDALGLSEYLTKRGGSVVLKKIHAPENEFANEEKGDALYAMELTLAMDKLQFEKYFILAKAAEEDGDSEMVDYISKNYLHPQVLLLMKHGHYVSQLRAVDKGHGQWHWDKTLHGSL